MQPVFGQQIQDVWQTKWDRTNLFSNISPSTPINFVTPGSIGSVDIVITDSTVYQQMDGFGGSLTDSSASILAGLKSKNSANYASLMKTLFDPTDGANAAGLNVIRVPIGASDYSTMDYSLDDTSGDTSLSAFSIGVVPADVWTVLSDIKAINQYLKVLVTPWSPPGWMKDSTSMNGGSLLDADVTYYANYLLKAVQGFNTKGFKPWAISIQNEPNNSNGDYPTAKMTSSQMAQVGSALRTLLNNNSLSSVIIIGYDHNWDDPDYPIDVMKNAESSFDGAAFHCYATDGVSATAQTTFHNAYSSKNVYFTECSGTYGSDWWSDIKWNVDQLTAGSVENWAKTVLFWNIALDGSGNPHIPTQTPCGSAGCRPIATVNSDGSYSLNQEYYNLAQAARAVNPKDVGGPYGQRIEVTLGGSMSWALRVTAFVTERISSSDWNRYSIVVLNWDDSSSTTFNPVDVTATIEFRGKQATYTFPVGVTTLWWYAAAE
ncbi:glycoside hydrolase family 30 protein [Peniophora sp. CONT]|nr:glycoside hydrolase family 30 protein [Peniophora sp. CONT]